MVYIFRIEIAFIIIISLLNTTKSCSDENCEICPNNKDYCTFAKDGFYTNNGTVLKCNDHCEKCSGENNCTKCESDLIIYQGMCVYYGLICQNKFKHCRSYCTEDKCLDCESIYKINDKGKCVPDNGFLALFICVSLVVITSSILCSVCAIYYSRKTERRNLEQNRIRNNYQNANNVQIIVRSEVCNIESNRSLYEKILNEEFEEQKLIKEKTEPLCQFCKKNIARYVCDCGCVVCDEHSKLKEDKENNKICFVCGKIVKIVKPKFYCEICMEDVLSVAYFKCNCPLEVCSKCYVKCKFDSNKCPACRKLI